MKYPKLRENGKIIKYNKSEFRRYKKRIADSITFDNKENDLGLTRKDISLLSWNAATMCLRLIIK